MSVCYSVPDVAFLIQFCLNSSSFFAGSDLSANADLRSRLRIDTDQTPTAMKPPNVSSPRVSTDSVLSYSVFETTLAECSPIKPQQQHQTTSSSISDCDSGDESDVSSHPQYDTVKRRLMANSSTSGVVSSIEFSDEHETDNSR